MKKQELIHLHGLLAQVQSHYEQDTGDSVDITEYANHGVEPTSIHKSKTEHKDAVAALAHCLTDEMTEEKAEPTPAAAD